MESMHQIIVYVNTTTTTENNCCCCSSATVSLSGAAKNALCNDTHKWVGLTHS